MKPPPHEDEAAAQEDGDVVQTQYAPQIISLEGRAEPVELILRALEATGATGVGRLLDVRAFDGDPRR